MKVSPVVGFPAAVFVAMLFCQTVMAQEAPAAAPLPDQTVQAVGTFIPGRLEVKPFTPPPPPVVKRLPVIRIHSSVTRRNLDGTTLTVQRGEPSTEPDLPPPPPPSPYVAPRELTPEEIARQLYHRRHALNLGAAIYDHQVSVVTWTDPGSLVRYEAVCGFDLSLLAGVGRFVHAGEGYALILVHFNYDTTRWRGRRQGQGRDCLGDAAYTVARALANHFKKTGYLDRRDQAAAIRDVALTATAEPGAAGRGITPARIALFTAAITEFSRILTTPRGQTVNRAALLKEVETRTAALLEQLRDLDDLIVQFASSEGGQRFIQAWQKARIIVDAGHGHSTPEDEEPAPHAPPVP